MSDFEDFVTRTGIEIAAGKAPDIFFGSSIFGDAAISLIEKGAFVDLAPFMETDGIREEDYFRGPDAGTPQAWSRYIS